MIKLYKQKLTKKCLTFSHKKLIHRKPVLNALMLLAVSGYSAPGAYAGPFDKNAVTGTLAVGSAQLFAEDYFVLGLGAGYFITDGFQAGLEVSVWSGAEPSIYEVTPRFTYVFDNPSSVKPYLGVFYQRKFIENLEDINSLGYRAGFYSVMGERAYIGIGAVYTELQDCTETVFNDCSSSYTELSFVFTL